MLASLPACLLAIPLELPLELPPELPLELPLEVSHLQFCIAHASTGLDIICAVTFLNTHNSTRLKFIQFSTQQGNNITIMLYIMLMTRLDHIVILVNDLIPDVVGLGGLVSLELLLESSNGLVLLPGSPPCSEAWQPPS